MKIYLLFFIPILLWTTCTRSVVRTGQKYSHILNTEIITKDTISVDLELGLIISSLTPNTPNKKEIHHLFTVIDKLVSHYLYTFSSNFSISDIIHNTYTYYEYIEISSLNEELKESGVKIQNIVIREITLPPHIESIRITNLQLQQEQMRIEFEIEKLNTFPENIYDNQTLLLISNKTQSMINYLKEHDRYGITPYSSKLKK